MSDRRFPPTGTLALAVWLREPYPYGAHEQQAAVLDRIRELEAAGVLDRTDVAVWGHHVPATPSPDVPEVVREVREEVAVFERWADREGCSLAPAFDTCRWSGDLLTEPTEVVSLPLLCLALYADGDLVSVTPCRGGPVETVGECLSALERAAEASETGGGPSDGTGGGPGDASGDDPGDAENSHSDAENGPRDPTGEPTRERLAPGEHPAGGTDEGA